MSEIRRLRNGGEANSSIGEGVYNALADLLTDGQANLFMFIFDHLRDPDENTFAQLPEGAQKWLDDHDWLATRTIVHPEIRDIALSCIDDGPAGITLVSPWADDDPA